MVRRGSSATTRASTSRAPATCYEARGPGRARGAARRAAAASSAARSRSSASTATCASRPTSGRTRTRTYGVVSAAGLLRRALLARALRGHGLLPASRATSSSAIRAAVADDRTRPGARRRRLPRQRRARGGGHDAHAPRRAATPRDHPRIELLRHKQLIVGAWLPSRAGSRATRRSTHVAGDVAGRAAPIIAWLDEHVGATDVARRRPARPPSGVRVGLHLDAGRGLARAELPGAAVLGAQRAAADGRARARAIEQLRAAVLAAGRVGVDPGDERCAALPPRSCRSPTAIVAAVGALGHAGALAEPADPARARRRGAARRWRSTASVSGPTLTRPSATSSHASGAPSKPTPCSQIQRSACSAPQLWPTMPGQRVELPVLDAAGDRRVRAAGSRVLVRGSGASYEPRWGRCAQRRGGGAEAEIPLRALWPSASARPARAAPGRTCAVADRQPVAWSRVGQRLLDRARRPARLEQRAPQRAGGRAAGALEHRVADPGGAAAGGVGGAQVVRTRSGPSRAGRTGKRGALIDAPCRTPSHSHSG